MSTYLGLDAGGSRTRWVVVDGTGEVLRGGEGPAIQAASMSPQEASSRLGELLVRILSENSAPARPAAVVAGIAGAGDAATRAALEAQAGSGIALRVTGDVEVAAAVALAEGPGVALWAGTGSFAVARDDAGRLHRVGGRGPLLGDEGGGYDIVRRAARAVVRAADGLGAATALAGPMVEHFGAASAERLGVAMQRQPARDVAAAVPAVAAAAEAGDAVAREVLDAAARALGELAEAAARRSGSPPSSLTAVLGGGVLERVPAVAERLTRVLRDLGFAEICTAPVDGAHGAARLARALHLGIAPLCEWMGDGAA